MPLIPNTTEKEKTLFLHENFSIEVRLSRPSLFLAKFLRRLLAYRLPTETPYIFARMEVLERLLETRAELGFRPMLFLSGTEDLAYYLDAWGFDIYVFSSTTTLLQFCSYQTPLAPNGDRAHVSRKIH